MGDGTRGKPPFDDPEATQPGAPPDGVRDDSTEALAADTAATRLSPSGPAYGPPSRAASVPPRRNDRGSTPADTRATGRSSRYAGIPPTSAGVRPRRRRTRLNLPRIIVPIVFLAAVIALVTIAVDSGVIGGGKSAGKPAGTTTKPGKKASASPTVVKVRKVYVVKPGDTLSAIAAKFKTTENELMIRNDLTTTTLRVGQRLKLPPPSQ